MRSLFRSSSFRLALLYMGLFSASVLVLLGFLYWATAGYMARQTDATIEAEIRGLSEQYRTRGLAGLSRVITERSRKAPEASSAYLLTDQHYIPLLGNLDRWPDVSATPSGWLRFYLPGQDKHPIRAREFELRGGFRLLVGRDLHDLERTQGLILKALVVGLGMTILLGLAGGAIMTRGVLKRIESINQTSREIMHGDLSHRIPTQGTDDDFDQLAENLNLMLSRIQLLMDDVRRVSDNVAHDLRTPLARLLVTLEQMRNADLDPSQLRRTASFAITETERLLETFNALLRIARIEAREVRSKLALVDLTEVARDAIEFYEPLADEKSQTLTWALTRACLIEGDRHLLFQSIANLLDNAVKYTPTDGTINVSIERVKDECVIEISDTGPGVPEVHREAVLRRFFRLESARMTPGNGLGLALVDAVVRMHDACLDFHSNQPGLMCRLKFRATARRSLGAEYPVNDLVLTGAAGG